MSKPAVSFIRVCSKRWAFTLHFAGHKPVSTSKQSDWHKSKTPSLEARAIVSWSLLGLVVALNWGCVSNMFHTKMDVMITHNLLTVHHADGRCTWRSDVIVPQCLAFVGFVSCEGDFSLPESCPTWLWDTHLCVEDQRASTGRLAKLMNKELSESVQEADPRIG